MTWNAPAASCCRGARRHNHGYRAALRLPHCGRFSIAYRRRYGETPSQTLKRQAVFTATLGAMPSLFVSPRGRPAAFGPIETAAEHREIAADIADDLAAALTRAGFR